MSFFRKPGALKITEQKGFLSRGDSSVLPYFVKYMSLLCEGENFLLDKETKIKNDGLMSAQTSSQQQPDLMSLIFRCEQPKQKEVDQFIHHIVNHETDAAELILKKNPMIAVGKGRASDYAGRVIQGTGLEVANSLDDAHLVYFMNDHIKQLTDRLRAFLVEKPAELASIIIKENLTPNQLGEKIFDVTGIWIDDTLIQQLTQAVEKTLMQARESIYESAFPASKDVSSVVLMYFYSLSDEAKPDQEDQPSSSGPIV